MFEKLSRCFSFYPLFFLGKHLPKKSFSMENFLVCLAWNLTRKWKITFNINNIKNQSKDSSAFFNMTKTCSALKVDFEFSSIWNGNVTNFYCRQESLGEFSSSSFMVNDTERSFELLISLASIVWGFYVASTKLHLQREKLVHNFSSTSIYRIMKFPSFPSFQHSILAYSLTLACICAAFFALKKIYSTVIKGKTHTS